MQCSNPRTLTRCLLVSSLAAGLVLALLAGPAPTAAQTGTRTPTPGRAPSVTPTSEFAAGRIAFVLTKDSFASLRGETAIYVLEPLSGTTRPVTERGFSPAWSPDGKKIAFTSKRDVNSEIYVIDATGKNLRRLTNLKSEERAPAWSPDGKKIALVSDRLESVLEIYTMNPDGSGMKRLTRSADQGGILSAQNDGPAWSPDGQFIVFASRSGGLAGQWSLWVVGADGTDKRQLTDGADDDSSPAWSPDGKFIAFVSKRDGNAEIYVMDADGKNQKRLTDNPALDDSPTWSPDGNSIAFVSRRDENAELYVMDADGENLRRMTNTKTLETAPNWGR